MIPYTTLINLQLVFLTYMLFSRLFGSIHIKLDYFFIVNVKVTHPLLLFQNKCGRWSASTSK